MHHRYFSSLPCNGNSSSTCVLGRALSRRLREARSGFTALLREGVAAYYFALCSLYFTYSVQYLGSLIVDAFFRFSPLP